MEPDQPNSRRNMRSGKSASRSDKGLHRGLMRGIAPHGSSIVLSGGYVDDEDLGDVIIYTGEGGRDRNTGQKS